jgi:hypothetical protein
MASRCHGRRKPSKRRDKKALHRKRPALTRRHPAHVAKGLNRLLGRKGPVFVERYHLRVLTTPREVRNARAYVINNYRRHAAAAGRRVERGWMDPCSSWACFDGWRELTPTFAAAAAATRVGPKPVSEA